MERRALGGARGSGGSLDRLVADFLDVVLHLFTPDMRSFYRLEELWSDVPSVEVPEAVAR